MKRAAVLLSLLALLLSSCRAEVRLLLDVTEPGSGSLSTEVGIDDQLSTVIDQLTGDSAGILSEVDLGLNGETTSRRVDDMTVYTTTVDFAAPDEIDRAAAGNFESFALEIDDKGTTLDAVLDLAGRLDFSSLPLDTSTVSTDTLQAQVIVTLPGEPAEHNADEVRADGSMVWAVPFDRPLQLHATTTFPQSSFPWWILTLLVITIGLSLAVWFAAVVRDKRRERAPRPRLEPEMPEPPNPPETDPQTPFFDLDD
jgi:hypothetical protein